MFGSYHRTMGLLFNSVPVSPTVPCTDLVPRKKTPIVWESMSPLEEKASVADEWDFPYFCITSEEMENSSAEDLDRIASHFPNLEVTFLEWEGEKLKTDVTFCSVQSLQRYLRLNAMERADQAVLSQVAGSARGEAMDPGIIAEIQKFLVGEEVEDAEESSHFTPAP